MSSFGSFDDFDLRCCHVGAGGRCAEEPVAGNAAGRSSACELHHELVNTPENPTAPLEVPTTAPPAAGVGLLDPVVVAAELEAAAEASAAAAAALELPPSPGEP